MAVAFHRGEGDLHEDESIGKPIAFDCTLFQPEEVAAPMERAGFSIEQVTVRKPYRKELPTERVYVLARSAAESLISICLPSYVRNISLPTFAKELDLLARGPFGHHRFWRTCIKQEPRESSLHCAGAAHRNRGPGWGSFRCLLPGRHSLRTRHAPRSLQGRHRRGFDEVDPQRKANSTAIDPSGNPRRSRRVHSPRSFQETREPLFERK